MKHLYSLICGAICISICAALQAQPGNTCATAIAIPVSIGACNNTQVSNQGLTNSGVVPSGVNCTGYSGGDLWLSVVVPPSGIVTLTAAFIPGVTNFSMDINMAAYSGSCGSLSLIGCDDDSGQGFYPELTLSETPGSTVYLQLWDALNNQQSPFNFCANGQATCTAPTVAFGKSCGGQNEYNVSVNITNLGSAGSVAITNNAGAPAITNVTATGVYTVGPIALGTAVTVTVEHDSDSNCNVSQQLTDVGLGCTNVLTCGTDLNQTYCYLNSDNTVFRYSSPLGSDVTITFNSGLIQNGADKITIRDGVDASGALLFDGANGGNLAGLSFTATSGNLYLKVTSDIGGSCQDGSLGLGGGWNWDVSCDGTSISACNEAATVLSKVTFAESEIDADLSAVAFSGVSQCAGPGSRPDLYFKFTAVASVTYLRVEGGPTFDPAVEVYDQCGGSLLSCTNDAGAGLRELFWLTGLTPGEEYVYRVYHAGVAASSDTDFETAVAHIPFVQLRPDFCGDSDLVANSIIRSTQPSNSFLLEAFIWEFTELEAPFNTYEVESPNGANPQFRIHWFEQFEYGRSYSVRVKVRMYQGPNEGDYGPACTISLANPPGTALQAQYENGFFGLCDVVKAVPLEGTTNYRWTFDDGSNVLEYNSNSDNYFLPLQDVPGIVLGTSYTVNVFATGPGGLESTTSIPRLINMENFVPNTALNPAFIACGSTVALTQFTQAFPVCNASSYTFRFTNMSQPILPDIEVVRPNRVLVFSTVPGLIPGDTYNVAVKASAGGLAGDYSTECALSISLVGLQPNTQDYSTPGQQPGTFTGTAPTLTVFPNPVTGDDFNVLLESLGSGQQDIILELSDITGKIVMQERFGNSGERLMRRVQLDNRSLAPGIYLLNARINGSTQISQRLYIQ